MNEGFCECGCGKKTKIIPYNLRSKGWIKGQPFRFIHGHSGNWKGGKYISSQGYTMVLFPNHQCATKEGYVPEHLLMAEKALGKELSKIHEIHHFPNKKVKNFILIICEDRKYHHFLHQRYRALIECGNVHWKKCTFCQKWDKPENLYIPKKRGTIAHPECKRKYKAAYKERMEKK